MITVINHLVRKRLGISSIHYIVMDVCQQLKSVKREVSINVISQLTGVTTRAIGTAIDELQKSSPALLDDTYDPTEFWFRALLGDDPKLELEDDAAARKVIEFFNECNGTKYMTGNNMVLIKSILRSNGKLTFDHFKSVIIHKKRTWGDDPKMKEYNKPSTIFRSSQQFMRYLDDANMYWIKKASEENYLNQSK